MYILSHPSISARLLAKELSKLGGKIIRVSTTPIIGDKLVIRYGNSIDVVGEDTEYNSPKLIRLAGNKLRLSQFLSQGGKEFPHLNMKSGNPERFPVVVRTVINGAKGIGIKFVRNAEEFIPFSKYYWTYYYPFQFELGVHILGGNIVKVFKKVRDEDLPEEEFPRRNTDNGYSFSLRSNWKESYPGLSKFVEELFSVFPIQFARLDVGYDKNTGGFRLIEINSAPDLGQNNNTLRLYTSFLAQKILGVGVNNA